MINVTPLTTHATMKDYSMFLLCRFVLPHFINGTVSVHVVFDNPGRQPTSPKAFERNRRDAAASVSPDHKHVEFSDVSCIPSKWREHLSCRICKRALVVYLGQAFGQYAQSLIHGNKQLVLAGCFDGDSEDQAWVVSSSDKQPYPFLNCDAEEADTRVWLHAFKAASSRVLVCSPDTDVYHIGLPMTHQYSVEVIVQLSALTDLEHRYLDLNKLCSALTDDPDLAAVPPTLRPQLMQSLFICTGCDYISFFVGLGKATFLSVAFQHSEFVNANTPELPGTLASMKQENKGDGFLAFVRLVGTVYYIKHLASFPHDSSRSSLNSFNCDDPTLQHHQWFNFVRSTVWERIDFEDELPPSWEALGDTGFGLVGSLTCGARHVTTGTISLTSLTMAGKSKVASYR